MDAEKYRKRLLIGETAELLGITRKAIRHYEKLGLLGEPPRTQSGYRVYTADDLLRLHRIKTLQSLGLSLDRIKGVLGEETSSTELETVLRTLLSEVEGRISELETRRERLLRALAGEGAEQEGGESYMLELTRKHLGEHWEDLYPEGLEQGNKLWNTLDDFRWPEGYQEFQETFIRYLADHPDERDKLLALEKRFVALAHLPEDAPDVESLAGEYAARFEEHPLPESLAVGAWAPEPLEQALSGVMLGSMSPAQNRCMRLLLEHMEKGEVG